MHSSTIKLAASLLVLFFADEIYAWGEEGHSIVGSLAMEQIDDKAGSELKKLLGSTSRKQMKHACNWPDKVRPTPEWEHTYPWHYINQPRSSKAYDRSRHCADGNCLPERVKWAAARLGDDRLDNVKREQAFNFLCHFMGDLHQPMHNAYGEDQGGNDFKIEYRGKPTDLHTLWDHDFIERHHRSWKRWTRKLAKDMPAGIEGPWPPQLIDSWHDESRTHAITRMYPESRDISSDYEQEALPFIDSQLRLAGNRLAWVLNSVIGNGEVKISLTREEQK